MAELIPIRSIICPLGPEWRPWEVWHPPAVIVQITHEYLLGQDTPMTIGPKDFPVFDRLPETCRKGLYWRLTGIGKQQIEGLDR